MFQLADADRPFLIAFRMTSSAPGALDRWRRSAQILPAVSSSPPLPCLHLSPSQDSVCHTTASQLCETSVGILSKVKMRVQDRTAPIRFRLSKRLRERIGQQWSPLVNTIVALISLGRWPWHSGFPTTEFLVTPREPIPSSLSNHGAYHCRGARWRLRTLLGRVAGRILLSNRSKS